MFHVKHLDCVKKEVAALKFLEQQLLFYIKPRYRYEVFLKDFPDFLIAEDVLFWKY